MPVQTSIAKRTHDVGTSIDYTIRVSQGGDEWEVRRVFADFEILDCRLKSNGGVDDNDSTSKPLKPGQFPRSGGLLQGVRKRLSIKYVGEKNRMQLEKYLADLVSQVTSLSENKLLSDFLIDARSPRHSFISNAGGDGPRLSLALSNSKAEWIGPRLILILKGVRQETQGLRNELMKELLSGASCGLSVKTVEFPEGTPLSDHVVLAIGASLDTLMVLAERQVLNKRLDDKLGAVGGVRIWRPFVRARFDAFAGADAPETFFTSSEVIRLLHGALCAIVSEEGHRLLLVASACGDLDALLVLPEPEALTPVKAHWDSLKLLRPPPHDQLASYFGIAVASYFDFLHFYTFYLAIPAVLGLLFWIHHEFVSEFIDTGKSFGASRFSPFFAFVVAAWGTFLFAHIRQRAAVKLVDLGGGQSDDVSLDIGIADFYFKSRGLHISRTGEVTETLAKGTENAPEGIFGLLPYLVTVFAMGIMLFVTSGVVGLLLWIGDEVEARSANPLIQNSPLILYVGVVSLLQVLYDWLAKELTGLEKHMVHAEYVRSLTLKTACFQLLNYHGWFLYLAFWKKDMAYLRSQLFIFFTLKQLIGNFMEVGVPWLTARFWQRVGSVAETLDDSDEEDARGNVVMTEQYAAKLKQKTYDKKLRKAIVTEWRKPADSVHNDYLEIVILFCGCAWFAPVFPLGFLLGLLHIISEISADRLKVCEAIRRPLPQASEKQALYAWLDVFDATCFVGITVSVALLGIEGGWSQWHLFAIEHGLLLMRAYLSMSIPREPQWLTRHHEDVQEAYPFSRWLSSQDDTHKIEGPSAKGRESICG
eukprot:TRINITY_DN18170_c0_g1_i1.p1 TRINITY_DN18170_c0_g1~~TRINITY_DN18170_c0_g1_i1.p1  ORF type:complete len:833 (-),score=122.33 TRINITY_DN18170_c0_g1_i1:40-2490(-)